MVGKRYISKRHGTSVYIPGGYLLAFGGTRTFHRIAVAIEDAGFEIRCHYVGLWKDLQFYNKKIIKEKI